MLKKKGIIELFFYFCAAQKISAPGITQELFLSSHKQAAMLAGLDEFDDQDQDFGPVDTRISCAGLKRVDDIDPLAPIDPDESKANLMHRYDVLSSRFAFHSDVSDMDEIFGMLNGTQKSDFEDLNASYILYTDRVTCLFNAMKAKGLLEDKELLHTLHRMHETLWLTFQICQGTIRMKAVSVIGSQELSVNHLVLNGDRMSLLQDLETYTDFHDLLMHAVRRCALLGLRKNGIMLYKPKKTKDGYFTHCYEPYLEIAQFAEECVHPLEHNARLWTILTKGRNSEMLVNRLTKGKFTDLPQLDKDRHIFSFSNGVYFAARNEFYRYDNAALASTSFFISCKYHDMEFDDESYQSYDDPMDVPTPFTDSLFHYQNLKGDVLRWIYAFLGRLIYETNELDRWQVQLYVIGVAGSGKSTIGQHMSNMYDTSDIGSINNDVEKNFPLMGLLNCFVYFGFDVGKTFNLSRYLWQSMVSGEKISVSVKHKGAIAKDWIAPGILFGNELPSWGDANNSVARRLPLVRFDVIVKSKDGDMQLKEKMTDEWASFLFKINVIYKKLAKKNQARDIWSVLPPYFHEQRVKAANIQSSLRAFLSTDVSVTLDPNARGVQLTGEEPNSLQKCFNAFCKANNLKLERLIPDVYIAIFQDFKLSIYEDDVEHPPDSGQYKRTKHIAGIRLDPRALPI